MRHTLRVLAVLLLSTCSVWFVSGSELFAADQLIFGKKLLIKNPPSGAASNKVVHLGKDPSISVGAAGSAGDPQCSGAGGGGTSSLRIGASGGAGDVTIPLPCSGWTTNGTNSLYKYKDTSGATCTHVLVKGGVLAKAICKGSQVAIDLNGSMSPVAVAMTLNTQQYCTSFGGTATKDGSDDKTFLRKDALVPANCPCPPSGARVGGVCWFWGTAGADCDTTCAAHGLTYHTATASYAGSGGTDANCIAVAAALDPTASFFGASSCTGGYGCFDFAGGGASFSRCTDPATTSTAAAAGAARFCACQ